MQDEQQTGSNTIVHLLLPSIKLICIGLIQFYGIVDIPLLILGFFLTITIILQTNAAIYFFSRTNLPLVDVLHTGHSLNKWIAFPMITNIASVYQIFLLDYVFFAGIAAAHVFILTVSQLILIMKGSK